MSFNYTLKIYIYEFSQIIFILSTTTLLLKNFLPNKYISLIYLLIYYTWLSSNPIKFHKFNILNKINNKFKPFTIKYHSNFNFNKLKFPLIFKPDINSRLGNNIEIIHKYNDIQKYISKYGNDFIIQEFINNNIEIGLLYERHPFLKYGKIISIVEKKYDRQKYEYYNINIEDDISILRNEYISLKLTNIIDQITKNINKDIYSCRYDIILNDYEDLDNFNFKIVELNGIYGADFRTYLDINIFKILYYKIRYFFVRFLFGIENILLFNGCNIFKFLINIPKSLFFSYKYKIAQIIFKEIL